MSTTTLVILILIILLLGGGGYWGYSRRSYSGPGLLGIVVIVLLVLLAVRAALMNEFFRRVAHAVSEATGTHRHRAWSRPSFCRL